MREWILERGHRGRAVTSFRVERPARKPVRTLNEATPGGGVTSFSGSVRTRLEAVSGSAVEERLVEHETERPEDRSDLLVSIVSLLYLAGYQCLAGASGTDLG